MAEKDQYRPVIKNEEKYNEGDTENDLSFIINEDGKVYYNPSLFSERFNSLYRDYLDSVRTEMALREINGGRTKEYDLFDAERRKAHDLAAKQLIKDLESQGKKIDFETARRILAKMREEKIAGSGEKEMLRQLFLRRN